MPWRGTDGLERAEMLEKYLFPIEAWTKDSGIHGKPTDQTLYNRIHELLGERGDAKLFLASLLVSLLRAQQLAARKRVERRGMNG